MPRHKITGTISRGRTTEILRALIVHPEGLGSEVAIKRLHKEVARDEKIARAFLNEGRVGIALHHANVVEVLRASVVRGRPEIVMQYLPGASLDVIASKARQQKRTLDIEIAVSICHAAACGVAHMHELGLVHRHITPGNIMVMQGGCTKVIDFGAAIPGEKKPASRYTAPEFFRKGALLDARGDVYSLGAILYELTTGKSLFGGAGSPAQEIIKGTYEAPAKARSDYPGLLATIVKRCMSRDPKDRYQSLDALLLALEHFAADNRYTLSSRAVQAHLQKDLEIAPPETVSDKESGKDKGSARKEVDANKVTTIHFSRAAKKASPPPIPKVDREMTALDLAIG
jgi:serine/threonine-protein kinase